MMDNTSNSSDSASSNDSSPPRKGWRGIKLSLPVALSLICFSVGVTFVITNVITNEININLNFGSADRGDTNGVSDQTVMPAETPTPPTTTPMAPTPEPTPYEATTATATNYLTRQQVETFIRTFLPDGVNIRDVKHLNERIGGEDHGIAVEIYERGAIRIPISIVAVVDDIQWYDGNNFRLSMGNLNREGDYFVVGDDVRERLIVLWVIPEAVRQAQNH